MTAEPVIAIFDIGKTNKKIFLFNRDYKIVFEHSTSFAEIVDEDGDTCEDVKNIRVFIFDSLRQVFMQKQFDVKAINFSGYGASLVFVDVNGETCAPLYNYLKVYPPQLQKQFYNTYGGEEEFCSITASPVLGHLNSGMQLYRIKYQNPELYKRIHYALHLPQYLSYLLTGQAYSDLTSIGCHTNLWDFYKQQYHNWVTDEGIGEKLAPIVSSTKVVSSLFPGSTFAVGIGLHDSSAALIPYLVYFNEPFILLSTGTWCISLNPFNNTPLTKEELQNDCLSYLSYEGKPVKASRLFAGYEHEQEVKRLADHFQVPVDMYKQVAFDIRMVHEWIHLANEDEKSETTNSVVKTSIFHTRKLEDFTTYEQAYHRLILDIVHAQVFSTGLVLNGSSTSKIFVDGGFSKNPVYMNLIAAYFPGQQVFAASVAQASAMGAALCLHSIWNDYSLPADMIQLKPYIPVINI